MNLLGTIPSREWRAAKAFFNHPGNANAVKLSRKQILKGKAKAMPHSFVKINDVIYAIAIQNYLGSGSYGCVKIAQNELGENFAIKIEQMNINHDQEFAAKNKAIELEISAKITDPDNLPFLKGYAERRFDAKPSKQKEVISKRVKITGSIDIIGKRYTVTSLIKGKDLWEHPELGHYKVRNDGSNYISRCKMSTYRKYQYAREIAKALKMIHDLGVLHGDFKPSNLIYHENEKGISIYPIDFGMSFILKSRSLFSKLTKRKSRTKPLEVKICTRAYRAPEIAVGNRITPKCDIYSLGVIFNNNLQLSSMLCKHLLNPNPSARPSCNQIIRKLNKIINSLDKESEMIASHIIELLSQYIKPSEFKVTMDKQENKLHYEFINLDDENVENVLWAIESVFEKHQLAFNSDTPSNFTIDLYANHAIFSNPTAVCALKQDIDTQLDTMKISSQFFDSILVERQTLQMTTRSNLAYRQITNQVLYKIYDYLLDNQYEIEEEMWLMEHGSHLKIDALADYDVCITKNLASFNLEINPVYSPWHSVGDLNLPDADPIVPAPLHVLRKSKAYDSIFDYYASASKSLFSSSTLHKPIALESVPSSLASTSQTPSSSCTLRKSIALESIPDYIKSTSKRPSYSTTLHKSAAFESVPVDLASTSKSPILQQPCSSMSSLCTSFKEIQLDGDGADIVNSNSQSPARQSPR